ncbi:MAG: hypothetical protein LBQ36_04515 [Synergistaceae bacterium]|jgi:lipopolysaccharide export system protein LptA|nr:hypothetical protein [Synergistaceae bacterium]
MDRKLPATTHVAIALSIIAVAIGVLHAAEATLTADSMKYDPATEAITVNGNVHLRDKDGEIFGDSGFGAVDGSTFELYGNIRGKFTDKGGRVVNIICEAAAMKAQEAGHLLAASGDVKLTRGAETLTADFVTWNTEGERYSAMGDVLGDFAEYFIDADAASRDEGKFSASGIRKFSEHARKIDMSANSATGTIKDNEVTEMIAEGKVVVTMPDKKGVTTRVSGNKGVYSLARGTLVISGNASATQTGRSLKSENIVYFIDTGNIDALGSPALTFDTNRK